MLRRFRASGMGDCPDAEKTRESLTVFSSKFKDYCQGKPVHLYAYEALVKYDLLESTASEFVLVACLLPNHYHNIRVRTDVPCVHIVFR